LFFRVLLLLLLLLLLLVAAALHRSASASPLVISTAGVACAMYDGV